MYKYIMKHVGGIIRKTSARKMSKSSRNHRVGILGVPFNKGQKKLGVEQGPKALRESGLIDALKGIEGIDIRDFGDVTYTSPPPHAEDQEVTNMHQLPEVAACNRALSQKVVEVLEDNRICVTIGGDHSLGIGSIDGHCKYDENIVVLWVDAHADINTNATSESGSVHGMPLALVLKELKDYWPQIPALDWHRSRFSIRNLAYIGLRSVDKYERVIISKYGVPAFGMEDVQKYGITNVIKMALDYLDPKGTKSIHVSFDIDSLDKLEAPSTGTSVRGGLTLREGVYLMEKAYETGRLTAIDLVEVNPRLGSIQDSERTVEAAIEILKAGLGFSRKGLLAKEITDLPMVEKDW